jgi:hypothetical protein
VDEQRRGARQWLVPFLVALAAAVMASVAVFVIVGGGDDDGAGDDTVLLEPVEAAGPDPFSASVASAEGSRVSPAARAAAATVRESLEVDPSTGTLTADGTAPGLYGGSQQAAVCEPDRLVEFLEQNPDKAAAWARVIGIAPRQIRAYVRTLTPVVLGSDTWVTNHGFENGRATPRQAVLQAGTAVLVDGRGTPRVKCNCGNPLGPPARGDLATVRTAGRAWAGFAPRQVTVVRVAAPVPALTLVDLDSGTRFEQPVGAVASEGSRFDLRADGVHFTDDDGAGGVLRYNAARDRVVDTFTTVFGEPTSSRVVPTDGICEPETELVEWPGVTLYLPTGTPGFRIAVFNDGVAPDEVPEATAAGVPFGKPIGEILAEHPGAPTATNEYGNTTSQSVIVEQKGEAYGVLVVADGGVANHFAALTYLEDTC